jgi:hypothetical protein
LGKADGSLDTACGRVDDAHVSKVHQCWASALQAFLDAVGIDCSALPFRLHEAMHKKWQRYAWADLTNETDHGIALRAMHGIYWFQACNVSGLVL